MPHEQSEGLRLPFAFRASLRYANPPIRGARISAPSVPDQSSPHRPDHERCQYGWGALHRYTGPAQAISDTIGYPGSRPRLKEGGQHGVHSYVNTHGCNPLPSLSRNGFDKKGPASAVCLRKQLAPTALPRFAEANRFRVTGSRAFFAIRAKKSPATTYSPTYWQYHRRKRA